MNLIDRIFNYFKGGNTKGIESHVADIDKAQKVLAEVLAEVNERELGDGRAINEFAQKGSFSLSKAVKNILDNPNFVKWFGDSKVVDEKGEPLVVYHGTDAKSDFDSFQKAPYDVGMHFGSAEVAQSRLDWKARPRKKGAIENRELHRIIPVYLALKNPLILDSDPTMWNPDNLPFFLENHTKGIFSKKEIKELKRYESLSYEAELRAADEYDIELDDIEVIQKLLILLRNIAQKLKTSSQTLLLICLKIKDMMELSIKTITKLLQKG